MQIHLYIYFKDGMRYRSEADFTYGLRLGVKKGTDISNYPFLHAGCNVFVLWESC